MEKRLTTPFTKDKIKDLKAGDSVLITGTIYTARDAAHERMTTNFKNGIPFPIDLTDNVIYYAGPCPAKPGEVIGSCGPTTAGRMDAYTPMLLDNGLGCMIGKVVPMSERYLIRCDNFIVNRRIHRISRYGRCFRIVVSE